MHKKYLQEGRQLGEVGYVPEDVLDDKLAHSISPKLQYAYELVPREICLLGGTTCDAHVVSAILWLIRVCCLAGSIQPTGWASALQTFSKSASYCRYHEIRTNIHV